MYHGLRLRRLRRARCRTDAVLCHIFEGLLPGLGFVGFVLLVSAVGWTGLLLSQFSGIPAHIFLQLIVEASANFSGDRILDPEPRGNLEIQI